MTTNIQQCEEINVRENRKDIQKLNNPEELATQGTQDEVRKTKHNTICV